MFCGGAVVVSVFFLWNQLILRPLGRNIPLNPLWLGTVLLSFFWWIQALAWGVPLFPGRPFITLLVGVTHLLIGICPLMPIGNSARWRWLLLASMLLTPSVRDNRPEMDAPRGLGRPVPPFHPLEKLPNPASAAYAQAICFAVPGTVLARMAAVGLMLPGLAGGVACAIIPLIFVAGKQLAEPSSGFEIEKITLTLMLILPLTLAAATAMAMGS